jgi:hypothetical protein
MRLLTRAIQTKLLKNGQAQLDGNEADRKPVLKLFTPWGAATWLLTELDPRDNDTLFGLCDLGHGEPELGYVSLTELASLRGPFGLKIERDMYFEADKPLSQYADEARANSRIMA